MNKTRPFRMVLYVVLVAYPNPVWAIDSPNPAKGSDPAGNRVLSGATTLTDDLTAAERQVPPTEEAEKQSFAWQGPARLDKTIGGTSGTLILSDRGAEFRPEKGASLRWAFVEIRTADLEPRRLVLTGYEKRGRLRPGTRPFRFDLTVDMPPQVAAEFAVHIGRPVRNANPQPEGPSIASIPVFHRTRLGGSNGTLHFRNDGVTYLTEGRDRRFWRWSEIQTLSNLDPYHLVVFGHRDVYTFELKQPLPRDLYERLSDEVHSRNAYDPRLGLRVGP